MCVAMSQGMVNTIGQYLGFSNMIGQDLLDSTTNEMLRYGKLRLSILFLSYFYLVGLDCCLVGKILFAIYRNCQL